MKSKLLRYGLMVVGVTTLLVGFQNFSASNQKVQREGTLEVLHEDYPDKSSRTRHYLSDDTGQRYELKFKGRAPHVLSGSKVRVEGEQSGNMLALDSSGGTSLQVLAHPPLNRMGAQKTAVFLVTYEDNPVQPETVSAVQDLVFTKVNDFYRENSYQQAWLSGTVFGWYTIPVASSNCDIYAISNAAKNAAMAAGADLSLYTNFVYMFPRSTCFTWAGLAEIGGNPSNSWINGRLSGVSGLNTVGHELGHNLGVLHAKALNCDESPITTNCNYISYGDPADIMGSAWNGHMNAVFKEYLGWLNNGSGPPITTVGATGSYTLDPYETNTTNPKALKILKSIDPTTGMKTWYYIEYRQPIGFDSDLNRFTNMASGVTVRLGTEDMNDASNLLDMTFNSIATTSIWSNSDHEDGALLVGNSFTDTAAGVTITATWANTTGAGVDVKLVNPPTPTPSPTPVPSLSASVVTDKSSYSKGSTVYLTALVLLNGNPASGASVKFTITKPNGAVVSATATTDASGRAVYKLRMGRKDPVGVYQVQINASSGSQTATASTSFSVQ